MIQKDERRIKRTGTFAGILLLGCLCPGLRAQDLANFEESLTQFQLDNGLTFIVLERHEAPVVTLLTLANVGSVNEQRGQTGLAHLFEHLAFKGTTTVGTRDYKAERKALAKLDELFLAMRAERLKIEPDGERLEALQAQFQHKRSSCTTNSSMPSNRQAAPTKTPPLALTIPITPSASQPTKSNSG